MDIIPFLLPSGELEIMELDILDDEFVITVASRAESACCPTCQCKSTRRHGNYLRHPKDLPWSTFGVQLRWLVRRFLCPNPHCDQRTFAERFPGVLQRYARMTCRLTRRLQYTAIQVGGELGRRILKPFAMSVSGDTLLRLIHRLEENALPAPVVIGVDDWAKRKRHSYGTIIVDLERHHVIDVLDDRSSEVLAQWLALHPTVRFVARDRSQEYRKGISRGAADAEQIADRFHLLQNMTATVQRFFERHPRKLRDTVRQCSLNKQNMTGPLDPPPPEKGEPTASEVRFDEVKRLQRQGHSKRDITRLAGVSRTTVTRYWNEDALPTRQRSHQNCSKVTPFHDHIVAMWNAGQQSCQALYDHLLQNGFEHSYHSVYRYTKHLLRTGQLSRMTNSQPPVPSPMHHQEYRPRKAA